MRALSAGGNYSDYANSGFCSTPLPGGGLLLPPRPAPIPTASLPLLLSAPSFMPDIYNTGVPEQFQTLFGTPRTRSPSPPHRHLAPPPSRTTLQLATLLHCLSINLFIFRRGKFREGTRSTQRENEKEREREREREEEVRSVGTKGRKEGRKEFSGEFNRRVDLCRVCGS